MEQTKQKKPSKVNLIFKILLVVFIINLIFSFNFSIVIVQGQSMTPTYNNHELLLAKKHYDYLNRFDTVVIYNQESHKVLIKRVIGLPGETVEYKNNTLYINNTEIEDIHNYGSTNDFKITVEPDSYFCLGDNRMNSSDSRKYGAFNKKFILGKII